jgi:hypothetical protein
MGGESFALGFAAILVAAVLESQLLQEVAQGTLIEVDDAPREKQKRGEHTSAVCTPSADAQVFVSGLPSMPCDFVKESKTDCSMSR